MKPQPEAYAAFIDGMHEHQGILGRICSVYANSPEDRDDLRQEILLQAWRSFGSFRGEAAFSTWLYRVALNTALMRGRKAAQGHEQPLEWQDEELLAAPRAGEGDVDLERLEHCIRRLPSLERAIVLLALERRSYDEIAEITGLSSGNIGVRLVRIKEKLRQRLIALGREEE